MKSAAFAAGCARCDALSGASRWRDITSRKQCRFHSGQREQIMDEEKHIIEEEHKAKFSRRYFLEIVGASAVGLAAVGSILLSADYLSPNVVKEPPTKFKAGLPEEYPP